MMTDSSDLFPPEVVAVAERMRAIVKLTLPEVEERVYKGKRGFGYHDSICGAFCGIFLRADAVYLMLRDGAYLPDPDKLLRGDGDQFLYVTLRPGEDLPELSLGELINAAVEFGRDRYG